MTLCVPSCHAEFISASHSEPFSDIHCGQIPKRVRDDMSCVYNLLVMLNLIQHLTASFFWPFSADRRVCSTLIVKLHWYCSWTVANKLFLSGESYVPKFGMYIPSLGTYIPKHETYIPKYGIYFLSLTKNFFSEAKKQFCYREKIFSLQPPVSLREFDRQLLCFEYLEESDAQKYGH